MSSKQRAVVGVIHPTTGAGGTADLERLLPAGIRFISRHLGIREQNEEEFRSALGKEAALVDEVAAEGPDLLHPIGAPVFMVHGYAGEQRIIGEWEAKHGIPMFTSGQSHVNALRALGIRHFVGLSPMSERMNEIAAQYFKDAGFDVLALDRVRGQTEDHTAITWKEAYDQARRTFEAHPGAEAVYFISSGWRIMEAIPELERDLGVPVVHPVPARAWEIQRRLGLKHPVKGSGQLMEKLPALVER
jgi:maleate cis-trans isomerase